MTTRERNLATILIAVVGVLGVAALANAVFLQPFNNLRGEIEKADQQLDQRDAEIKAEQNRIARIEQLNPRLTQWEKLSLPQGDPKPEAFKAHLIKLRREYNSYLSKVLTESGFKKSSLAVKEFDARTAPTVDKKAIGYVLPSKIEGDASLESVVKLFEELYRAPILHQVKTFSITSVRTSKDLTVKMSLEALLVNGADHISKRNGDIFAKFTNKGKDKEPILLARPKGGYREITSKNIFSPPTSSSGPERPDEGKELIAELTYVHLTMISYSDYYGGCWVARIHNRGNKDDTALLIDAPLPKKSPYLKAKKDLEDKRRTGQTLRRDRRGDNAKAEDKPEEPVQKWEVKDHDKNTLLELQVVRITPFRVIFQAKDKFYSVYAGESLRSAMYKEDDEGGLSDNPLDKEQLKKVGLVGDPTEVLKKVKLAELRFSKDRDAFEGKFVNPENKAEKKTLAVDATPEEFASGGPPKWWPVKDHFGTEVLKLTVLRVEKERFFFEVDKKVFVIKPGGSLHDAMAKPLPESEVKALGLRGT